MSNAIAGIDKRIVLPGCEIRANALIIPEDITSDQLAQVKGTLKLMEESALWWWGDYLVFCEFKRGISYEAAAGESGYAPESLRKARRISLAFESGSRLPLPIGWNHHHDALCECGGDAKKALDWLNLALVNGWSKMDMREAIRAGLKQFQQSKNDKGQSNVMDWVLSIKSWFRKEPTKEAAIKLLPDLEAVTEQCRKIAEGAA